VRAGALVASLALVVAAGCTDSPSEPASASFCTSAEEYRDLAASVTGLPSADDMRTALRELEQLAEEAPAAVEEELSLLVGVLEDLVVAMEAVDPADPLSTSTALQSTLTPDRLREAGIASTSLAHYLSDECGLEVRPAAPTSTAPPTSQAPAPADDLGDDATSQPLAVACTAGDMVACDELYFAAPDGSAYEAHGDSCGGRTAADGYCVELYPTPTGS
jgi:hypothetical protein